MTKLYAEFRREMFSGGEATMDLDESTGPLAEFTALRNEIDSLWKAQMQLFVLQLTATGAIFSFVLSHRELAGLLLIVPVASYLIGARYAHLEESILLIGSYIGNELHDRVPGGLGWERWWRSQAKRGRGVRGWAVPLFLTFPGAGILALAWCAFTVQDLPTSDVASIGLVVIWAIGAAMTVFSIYLFASVFLETWVRGSSNVHESTKDSPDAPDTPRS